MPSQLKLEPPFYLPEVIERILPLIASEDRGPVLPEDALSSNELSDALNAALRKSIEASLL
jgi:hypothetical protein